MKLMLKVDVDIIYGIDVAKGSSRARELPRYAVAILNVKGGEVTHHTMLRRHRILRMLHQDQPSIIAVDNIFELAANKKEFVHELHELTTTTRGQQAGPVNETRYCRQFFTLHFSTT